MTDDDDDDDDDERGRGWESPRLLTFSR